MKTTNPSSRITISQNGNQISRITISQNGNQILYCEVYKEPNYILSMSNEEILELISGLDYMGNIPTVPELQGQFMDLVVEYMEESINWPDPDDQETFEKQLLG